MTKTATQPETDPHSGFQQFDGGSLMAYGSSPSVDTQARAESAGKAPTAVGQVRRRSTERTVQARRMARLEREQNAAEVIGSLPDPGADVVMVMDGTYHGWDVLGAILELAGDVTVAQAYITTLGFNRTQTDHLADLLNAGKIERLTFIVSEMFSQKNADEYEYLAQTLTDRGQQIANTRNHAKLMLLKFSDGRHIVTHGSLNLRRCNSFEQLVISHDRDLYEFFEQFIKDVIDGGFQP